MLHGQSELPCHAFLAGWLCWTSHPRFTHLFIIGGYSPRMLIKPSCLMLEIATVVGLPTYPVPYRYSSPDIKHPPFCGCKYVFQSPTLQHGLQGKLNIRGKELIIFGYIWYHQITVCWMLQTMLNPTPKHHQPRKHPCTFFAPLLKVHPESPRCSMYGIFTYIWTMFWVNVGRYSIHGASRWSNDHNI